MPRVRGWTGAALAALLLVALPAAESRADTLSVPLTGSVEISGRGFGHGMGLSQWGAQGAALQGLTWQQIIAFYFPGTTVGAQGDPALRIGVTVDSDGATEVVSTAGQTLRLGAGAATALPSDATTTAWRVTRRGTGLTVSSWDTTRAAWVEYTPPGYTSGATLPSPAVFDNPTTHRTRLVLPSGVQRDYPDRIGAVVNGTGLSSYNDTTFEPYLRGVVGAEMPPSWAGEALRSQAVAARTYAAYEQAHPRWGSAYDVCDSTSCQVYRGLADYRADGTLVADYRYASVDAAITATAGMTVRYGQAPALTMFGSSNGGWTVAGNVPYLVAKADPYDASTSGSSWSISGSTGFRSKLESAYPAIGSLRQLVVTRDGRGLWGGRVVSADLIGTTGTASGVSGARLQSILGIRSTWFTLADTDHLRRDLTGDGQPDVLGVTPGGLLMRLPGKAPATGVGFGAPTSLGPGWQTLDLLRTAGDLDGNGRADIFGRVRATGQRVCYPVSAAGTIGTRVPVAGDWSAFGELIGVGDMTSDGRPDFISRRSDGRLMLFQGDGTCGGWTASQDLGPGWNAMDAIMGVGDADRDGNADIIARERSTGILWLYTRDGISRWTSRVNLGPGWNAMTDLVPAGDADGLGGADVLARDTSGQAWLYQDLGGGVWKGRSAVSLPPTSYVGLS